VIEQQEAANESLQAANEEVQSANEELQSINEELETSKEEVQSTNEELATLNEELHNRNLELSLSNNDFVNLLNSVQMAIVMLGSDLRIRRFTPMAEKLFNLLAGDIGRPISNLKVNFGISDLEELITEVIDTLSDKEIEVTDRDGRWYSLRIRPYRTTENHIDGAVLVVVDVDTLKRNQDALRRQSELLEQAHEPIVMWELDGPIIYWNRGAEEVYGFSKEQVIGRVVFELLETQPGPDVVRAALEADGRWSGELLQRRADRRSVVVESRMAVVHEPGGPAVVIETDLPVTERKQMEQALRVRAEELLAADRSKNEFLATLAHELRNPLAPLRNLLEVLRTSTLDRAAIEHACETMDHQVQNMARLTDDLLDVARMTHGRIQLRRERRELLAIVRQAVELHRHIAEERGQQLVVSLPADDIHIDADAMRVEQLLGNLLSNASKFTPAGGHIWVSVERQAAAPGASEPDQAVIRVRDDGEGLPAETLPRIFDLFVQADRGPGRAQGGLGIGLTLVRRLVELHEGSVQGFSAGAGQGSEFVVRLPILPARASRSDGSVAASPRVPGGPARRVLIVDDSVDSAESLAQLLRLQGHEVHTAYDGVAAVATASRHDPDVIILDIGLPGVDGYETTRRLREQNGGRRPVIVALTGYGAEADRERAERAGFDHHMTKPPDLARLRAIIADLRSN
jgi:two-component system CheB/CheR fusion protein